MAVVVSLRDFIGEMQMLSDDRHAYLNKVTGELIMITDDDFAMAERDEADEFLEWQNELVQDAKRFWRLTIIWKFQASLIFTNTKL